jgi:hypothetical protein
LIKNKSFSTSSQKDVELKYTKGITFNPRGIKVKDDFKGYVPILGTYNSYRDEMSSIFIFYLSSFLSPIFILNIYIFDIDVGILALLTNLFISLSLLYLISGLTYNILNKKKTQNIIIQFFNFFVYL